MLRIIMLALLIFTTFSFQTSTSPQTTRQYDEWLLRRYFEAVSIEQGMTRAELLKVFRMDGGLQSFLPTRYVLRTSNMVKVDVEFEVPAGLKGIVVPEDLRDEIKVIDHKSGSTSAAQEKYQIVANEKLKIRSISRPYLEQFNYD